MIVTSLWPNMTGMVRGNYPDVIPIQHSPNWIIHGLVSSIGHGIPLPTDATYYLGCPFPRIATATRSFLRGWGKLPMTDPWMVYMLKKGIYWWDRCDHINHMLPKSSTMDRIQGLWINCLGDSESSKAHNLRKKNGYVPIEWAELRKKRSHWPTSP